MRGRKPISEKAMTAAERMRQYRLRKKQRAPVRPSGYSEHKAGVLKQFAEFVELAAKRDGYKIKDIVAKLDLDDNVWRAIRRGGKGRIALSCYKKMLEAARKQGWTRETRVRYARNLIIFERVRSLQDKKEWEKEYMEWLELERYNLESGLLDYELE